MDEAQLTLGQYARWYKSLFELPGEYRPDDELLEDDERLDRWFQAFQRDLARKSGRKQSRASSDEQMQAVTWFGG